MNKVFVKCYALPFMAEHHYKRGSQVLHGILDTPEDYRIRYVPCDPYDKDLSQRLVEDEFRRHSRIRT